MARDPEATRSRILDAATEEFAAHGPAGARIDRIARRAKANKERIYAYFGSKDRLFDAVVEHHISQLLDAVPFDADDLPGYAARLRAFNAAHPDLVRLLLWHSLAQPGALADLPVARASTARKIEAVAEAQRRGVLSTALPAPLLLRHVLALVHADVLDGVAMDDRLEEAVARLVR